MSPRRPMSTDERDWRYGSSSGSEHTDVSTSNGHGDDDHEELLREREIEELESHLTRDTRHESEASSSSMPSLSFSRSLPSNDSAFSVETLQTLRPPSARNPSSKSMKLPLHTSALDHFGQKGGYAELKSPPMTRHTTYSSLPGSPTEEMDEIFFETREAVAMREFGRLVDAKLQGEAGRWGAEEHGHSYVDDALRDGDALPLSPSQPPHEVDVGENPAPNEVSVKHLSIWDLLKEEVTAEDWQGWGVESKWERIANFLAVPLAVEKITLFGALLCLDGFLYNFTILPIRAAFAIVRLILTAIRTRRINVPPSHLQAILRLLLVLIPTFILLLTTDASKMYHKVRGQDTIKLYVIFNALEIADRLCGAFGQDLLDTLFAKETLNPSSKPVGKGRKRQRARPVFFFMLTLCYVLAHSLVFFYLLVSLNVAINSYDNALLSLLVSNQFVEIKGSVFKKFEKENLFQIMCADIVERFQLGLMLSVIAIRNIIEMAGSDFAFLPKNFVRGKSLVEAILSPVVVVLISETLVDWLKHAFITKFNHVRASVYDRFTDVLCKDVVQAGETGHRAGGRKHPVFLDQSPLVSRRLGFASIPLACLVIRVGVQAIGMLTNEAHRRGELDLTTVEGRSWSWTLVRWIGWGGVTLGAWACLVALKTLLGLTLLSFATLRQAGMEEREAADVVNDFGRSGVGDSLADVAYAKDTSRMLSRDADDLPPYRSPFVPPSENPSGSTAPGGSGKAKGKKWKLEEVERWTMVKRIW